MGRDRQLEQIVGVGLLGEDETGKWVPMSHAEVIARIMDRLLGLEVRVRLLEVENSGLRRHNEKLMDGLVALDDGWDFGDEPNDGDVADLLPKTWDRPVVEGERVMGGRFDADEAGAALISFLDFGFEVPDGATQYLIHSQGYQFKVYWEDRRVLTTKDLHDAIWNASIAVEDN